MIKTNKIVKVIYQDGTEDEVRDIKKLDFEGIKDRFEISKIKNSFEKQFRYFERTILENINQSVIENYAECNLGLIEEEDVEETHIDDFSDKDILDELSARKILGGSTSVVNEDFLFRFSKIMDKENHILLESVLMDFEKKLRL